MSERSFRRRILAKAPKTRPPSQPIPPPRRRTPTPCRSKPSKPIEVLERCSSEPILYTVGLALSDDENRSTSKSDVPLYRLQTCMDVFTAASSPLISPSPSSHNVERYNEEAKVVVSVTVEGSPGPVRTMVRLGSSVEDTIRLVVQKYSEEGRSPQLDLSAASSFQLHHSYFSLESLDKTEKIGETGTRSFYLRKGGSGRSNNSYHGHSQAQGMLQQPISSSSSSSSSSFSMSEVVSVRESAPLLRPPVIPLPRFVFFPAFIGRKMGILGRRTRKLWKILGCI